jgi:ABC-type glycerol-3-phosphate transport system permease component
METAERSLGRAEAGERARIALPRLGSAVRQALLLALQATVVMVFVLPFLWMILGSLRPEAEIFRYLSPFQWHTLVPIDWTLDNYVAIFGDGFGRYALNSLIIAAVTVPLAILFDSMAAFAFAWLPLPGRNVLFGLLLLILLIPEQSTILPLYLVARALQLQNTLAAIILPYLARPFGIFLLRQSLLELPGELADAARVDGATPFQLYWHVMLPNVRPALVTVGLIDFMWAWNQFFWPLIAIQDKNKQVIQVAVGTFINPEQTLWSELFAAATLASLPVIVLFLIFQRYYVRGVARTGLHG